MQAGNTMGIITTFKKPTLESWPPLLVGMGLEHVLYELAVSLYGLHRTTASSKTLYTMRLIVALSRIVCTKVVVK